MRLTSSTGADKRATRRPKFPARLLLTGKRLFRAPSRLALTRAVSVSLIITILAVQSPAAPRVLSAVASDTRAGLAFWLEAAGITSRLGALLTGAQKPSRGAQEPQAQRDSRVSRIQISPGDLTVKEGDQVDFIASALDSRDEPVGGVRFKWTAYDLERNKKTRMHHGRFVTRRPGTYRVVAEGGRQEGSVTVRVEEDITRRPPRKDAPPPVERKVSSRDPQPQVSSAKRDDERRDKNAGQKRDRDAAQQRPAGSKGSVKIVKTSYAAEPAPAIMID